MGRTAEDDRVERPDVLDVLDGPGLGAFPALRRQTTAEVYDYHDELTGSLASSNGKIPYHLVRPIRCGGI